MQSNDFLKTINYIDIVNKFDNLINELLYSKNSGFINLKAKNALSARENVLLNYSYEADKIAHNYNYLNIENLIKQKRSELIYQINKHLESELVNWAQEVFLETINNCILKISLNKDNTNYCIEIYNNTLYIIDKFAQFQNINDFNKEKIIQNLNSELKKVINSNDTDYIEKVQPQKSDLGTYFKLHDLISFNIEEFNGLDLEKYKIKISQSDLNNFKKIKSYNKTPKISSIIDNLILINSSVEILN
ncbi:hypothetical protein IJ531_03665, partial [bacterium]|nr:hypothetical protein [bacterium]